jgi:hypothetical protein
MALGDLPVGLFPDYSVLFSPVFITQVFFVGNFYQDVPVFCPLASNRLVIPLPARVRFTFVGRHMPGLEAAYAISQVVPFARALNLTKINFLFSPQAKMPVKQINHFGPGGPGNVLFDKPYFFRRPPVHSQSAHHREFLSAGG